MKNSVHFLLFIFIGLFFINQSNAQQISGDIVIGDTTQVHVLTTTNNDRFIGRVTKIENTTINFLFQNKLNLEFQFNEIRSVNLKGEQVDSYTQSRRSQRPPVEIKGEQSLFFGPTAYTYGRNNGEYRNLLIFYNRANFGLSKNVDIGVDLMPLIAFNVVALKAKVGLPVSDVLSLGVGGSTYMLFSTEFGFNRQFQGAYHSYGVATFGNKDKFINLGVGYAFPFDSESIVGGATVINFGGAISLGRRWNINAEAVYLSNRRNPNFYSLGAKLLANSRNRFDFGISVISTTNNFSNRVQNVPIPFAQYAFMF